MVCPCWRPRVSGRGQLGWDEIADQDIDVVVFMPCGFDLAGSVDQACPLLDRPELAGARRFYAVDGNAYFSRPGPRVVDGVELLEAVLHPNAAVVSPPGATRLR